MRFLLSSLFVALIFSGCATKERIVTQEVYIPVKCQATKPVRPTKSSSYEKNILNILEYTEKLEVLVDKCVE